MKGALFAFVAFSLVSSMAFAAPAGSPHVLLQSNPFQSIISAIESFFNSIFGHPSTTSTVVQSSTTYKTTTTHPTTSAFTTIPIRSTTLSTITISTTTTVSPNATIQCKNNGFLRVNETLSCPPVLLRLVDVGEGNTRYEIANAIVNIYLNNNLVFLNQSLLQNSTQYYQFNLSNGHIMQVYVTTAIYSDYPVNRYATISIVYR